MTKDVQVEEKAGVFDWAPLIEEAGEEVTRFKNPSSPKTLDKLSKKTFAESTERKIEWAVELFRQWRYARMSRNAVKHEVQACDVDAIGVLYIFTMTTP